MQSRKVESSVIHLVRSTLAWRHSMRANRRTMWLFEIARTLKNLGGAWVEVQVYPTWGKRYASLNQGSTDTNISKPSSSIWRAPR
mmetsp:Transcript_38983/g.107317  ORF Transcript_38983/g.107317 Transcript_38983/m.107317 type:complete len:85 (+) Transcript_38983:296-550(+)